MTVCYVCQIMSFFVICNLPLFLYEGCYNQQYPESRHLKGILQIGISVGLCAIFTLLASLVNFSKDISARLAFRLLAMPGVCFFSRHLHL